MADGVTRALSSSELSLRALTHAGRLIRNPRAWHRLIVGAPRHAQGVIRGLLHRARGKGGRAESRNAIIDACRKIEEARIPMHMVFSSGDQGLDYLERRVGQDYVEQLAACGVTIDVIDGPDHTFRPLWSHDLLRDSLEAHLRRVGLLPAQQHNG